MSISTVFRRKKQLHWIYRSYLKFLLVTWIKTIMQPEACRPWSSCISVFIYTNTFSFILYLCTTSIVSSSSTPCVLCRVIKLDRLTFKHAALSLHASDIVEVELVYVLWLPPNERSKPWGPDPERKRWEWSFKSLCFPCSHSFVPDIQIYADLHITNVRNYQDVLR